MALIGELHAATASVLGDCLAQLSRIGATTVEFDVSGLRFLDCAGMAIFRQYRNAFEALGGSLVIQDDSSRALRLLGVSGMGRLLDGMNEHPSATGTP